MERMRKVGQVPVMNAREAGYSRLGIGFEKLDRKVFDPEKAYDLVGNLGVHYVRIQSGWQRTETVKGVYDFAWLDDIVDKLIARGHEPWIDLCYGNELYTERAKTVFGAVGCPPIFSQEEKDAWRAYVEATVRHFHGRVTWYEIWNEPDGQHCWKHGVSAAEYGDFAVETARAVHRADSEAKTIAGVLCSINLPYFKVMFDRGVCEVTDAVSFHRYNADETVALQEISALRALIDQYNPRVRIIQGESGTQSDSRGAGALRGGAWTPARQMKYLLRHRLIDLASEIAFTSHFTALDMVEALGGTVGDKKTYMDFGYFGLIQADFDDDGFATGNYSPKPSYRAMQNLCSIFREDVRPAPVAIKRTAEPSKRVLGMDDASGNIIMLGFARGPARALAYWKAVPLLTETFDGTVSFVLPCVTEELRLIDLARGDVYALPESMLERDDSGAVIELKNMPLTDTPLLLTIGDFAPVR